MTDPTCTDSDLARALDYARRLTASGEADDGTLLARALLRQTAELAAIDRALAGDPLPPDASERARRVAELARLACEGCKLAAATSSRCAMHEWPPAPEDDAHTWTERDGLPVCLRCGVVRNADKATPCKGSLPAVAMRAEDDGLTAEDRAKGWRWRSALGELFLYPPGGGAAWAAVNRSGWEGFSSQTEGARVADDGPETDAAGQRAAVAHLRERRVL